MTHGSLGWPGTFRRWHAWATADYAKQRNAVKTKRTVTPRSTSTFSFPHRVALRSGVGARWLRFGLICQALLDFFAAHCLVEVVRLKNNPEIAPVFCVEIGGRRQCHRAPVLAEALDGVDEAARLGVEAQAVLVRGRDVLADGDHPPLDAVT